MNKEDKEIKEEIRKEFQLDRIVLFSDAVFAIVITLMAIEIHAPDLQKKISTDEFAHEIIQLLPNVIAYTVSFFFIGLTWYQHLKLFSLLKDYDKGLVVRNLILLFFIGFFPFSVTLVARPNNGFLLPIIIYFLIIITCRIAQLTLQHYILVKRPHLRIQAGLQEELMRFKKSRLAIITLSVAFCLMITTMSLITDPALKNIAWWWFVPIPFIVKYFQKRLK